MSIEYAQSALVVPSSEVDKAILAQVVSLNGCTHSCLILCVHKRIFLAVFPFGILGSNVDTFAKKHVLQYLELLSNQFQKNKTGSWIEGCLPQRGPSLWLE